MQSLTQEKKIHVIKFRQWEQMAKLAKISTYMVFWDTHKNATHKHGSWIHINTLHLKKGSMKRYIYLAVV